MLTFTDDELKRAIQDETGIKLEWAAESFPDLEEDVRQSLRRVEASPFVTKHESLRGFIFDVATGRLTAAVAIAATLFALAAPAAFAIYNVSHAHNGPGTMPGPARDGGFGGGPGGPGGPGGRVGSSHAGGGGPFGQADNPALEQLVENAGNRWAAARVGSFTVSSLELKTGASLMAIGGFAGSDNSPTLAQFKQYVSEGQVRYFVASDRRGPHRDASGSGIEITQWVQQNFTPTRVGGTTVYDLSQSR